MIALAIGGVTAATVAYFSDTAAITGNTFSSGTMNLRIDSNPLANADYWWSDGFANPYPAFSNLYPGFTDNQVIDIANVGTVDGNATIDLNRTSAWSDLAGVLNFHVYYRGGHIGTWVDTGLNGTIDAFMGPYTLGPITGIDVSGKKTASVMIVWSVPTTAGNEIQGDSFTADVVFGLEQIH